MSELAKQLRIDAEDVVTMGAGWDADSIAKCLCQAADKIEELEAKTQWQPIETAPLDGTWIWLTDGDNVEPAYWGDSYFNSDPDFIQYAHRSECAYPELKVPYVGWMPLPEPPQTLGENDE